MSAYQACGGFARHPLRLLIGPVLEGFQALCPPGWAYGWGALGRQRPPILAFLLTLLLAACSSPPPRVYAPLSYDYLLQLRLNVATIEVQNNFVPSSGADVSMLSPVRPVDALEQMARDRLFPAGNAGKAVFTIDTASILHTGDALYGQLAVHLDILAPDGSHTGFAEARVARTYAGSHVSDDIDGALYDLTRQMMDDMNVEFEYQVRRSLKDWLQPPPGPAAPVQSQPLAPPS